MNETENHPSSFASKLQDALPNLWRNPEFCGLLQTIEQWTQLWNQSRRFGLKQYAKHANGLEPQLHRNRVAPTLVNEQGVRMYFQCESQGGGFPWIKLCGKNSTGDGGNIPLLNPGGQYQPLKTWSLKRETIELRRDLHWNDDLVKKLGEEVDLSDAAEVQQHRRVSDNNHDENNALSDAKSSSSICSVQMGMLRSPNARWKVKKSTPANSVAPTRPTRPRAYKAQASSKRISSGVRRTSPIVSGKVSVTNKSVIAE